MQLKSVSAVIIIFIFFRYCKAQIEGKDALRVAAAAGETAQLPCYTRPEAPDAANSAVDVLTWYSKSTNAIYSRDWRGRLKTSPATARNDERYSLARAAGAARAGVAHLLVSGVRPEDAGLYHCRVDFAAGPTRRTYVLLEVVEKPTSMMLLNGNGTKLTGGVAGPYREGEQAALVCVVFGGKPLPNVTWWHGDELLDASWAQFSLRRVRNEISLGALHRRQHGEEYTCRAHNTDLSAPLEMSVIVDMYLTPTRLDLFADEGPTRAGPLQMQCWVFGARPAPAVLWTLAGEPLDVYQELVHESSRGGDVSTVTVQVAAPHDGQNASCCVDTHTKLGLMCSRPHTLHVYYAPVLRLTLDGDVTNESVALLGSSLALACNITANPGVFDFHWYFNGEVIKSSDESSEQDTYPVLALQNVTSAADGVYRCSATNREGLGVSQDLRLHVHYSPYCLNLEVIEFGVEATEAVNITCNVSAEPAPATYSWVFVNATPPDAAAASAPADCRQINVTESNVLEYRITEEFGYGTVLCWGQNDVSNVSAPEAEDACYFAISGLSAPRPPAACGAVRRADGDLVVACEKGYDGGLPQKFTLTLVSTVSGEELVSVSAPEPRLTAHEPAEDYVVVVVAHNERGSAAPVTLARADVLDGPDAPSEVLRGAVGDVSKLLAWLGCGVGAVVLVACALALGAREMRSDAGSDVPRRRRAAPASTAASAAPCLYATDESNCDTCQDSEGGSENSFHRSDSFHRALSRRPSHADSQRAPSAATPAPAAALCRVHSAHALCGSLRRARAVDRDALCDHLLLRLPVDLPNYSIPKPPIPFYTMPRKGHQRAIKGRESSEAPNFDNLPLPPPPEEFHTFRSATDILNKECPVSQPSAATNNYVNVGSKGDGTREYNNVIISPMNTVGLPSSSAVSTLYTYPEDEQQSAEQPAQASSEYYSHSSDGRF